MGDGKLTPNVARDRISARRDLNAFISLTSESGEGPVVAVKDVIDVRGTITSNGGPIDGLSPASEDAPAVANLRHLDAVVIGKTNLYEWGFGVASTNRNHGTVPNPFDLSRSAGGSSSGSAVAVAAQMCDWAIGSDTAGSVRIPAALCGVVGFKPTRGLLSTRRVTPLSPSHDTLGALARTVAVATGAAHALAGRPLPEADSQQPEATGYRLVVPADWVDRLDDQTERVWAAVAAGLPTIRFPDRLTLFEASRTVQSYEAFRVHAARLRDSPSSYSTIVRTRLLAGRTVSDHAYGQALEAIAALADGIDSALAGFDAAITPTTAVVAPRLIDLEQPRDQLTRFTRPFSATGHPAITIPADVRGLPVGIQLVSRRGCDADLLRAAGWLELQLRRSSSSPATVEATTARGLEPGADVLDQPTRVSGSRTAIASAKETT